MIIRLMDLTIDFICSPSHTVGCGRANLQDMMPRSWSPAVNAWEPTEGRVSQTLLQTIWKERCCWKAEHLETDQRLCSLTDSTWKSCLEFPNMAHIQTILEPWGSPPMFLMVRIPPNFCWLWQENFVDKVDNSYSLSQSSTWLRCISPSLYCLAASQLYFLGFDPGPAQCFFSE